jgi:hypothetical protein
MKTIYVKYNPETFELIVTDVDPGAGDVVMYAEVKNIKMEVGK